MDTISLQELAAMPSVEVKYLRTVALLEHETRKIERFHQYTANGCLVKGMGANENDAGLIMVRASLGAGKAEELAHNMLQDSLQAWRDNEAPPHVIRVVENGKVVDHGFH